MRKFLISLGILIVILYAGLHAVVASSPIQRRVLSEIQRVLAEHGIEVSMESIELSAFAPRLYLNRVIVKTTPKAEIQLEHPLEIDKIKIEFQPLGLLQREIVLDEVSLFHPKIYVPHADELYKKVIAVLGQKKQFEVKGQGWPLVIKSAGIVDSQFEVASSNPSFSVRSRRLTLAVSKTAIGQQNIIAQSQNLELVRGKFETVLSHLDSDIDFTEQSVRANRLVVEGPGIKLLWKGACSLPADGKSKIESFHLSHETELDLAILRNIEELKVSSISGDLRSSGTLHVAKESYSGTGNLAVSHVQWEGNSLGEWSFLYALSQKELELTQVKGSLADGSLESSSLKMKFQERMPFQGELAVRGVEFNQVLASLQSPGVPVFFKTNGKVRIQGNLEKPLSLNVEPELRVTEFWVINKYPLGKINTNTIIHISDAQLKGSLSIAEKGLDLKAKLKLLEGELELTGSIADKKSVLQFVGEGISLNKLKAIAGLPFGGQSKLKGEIRIQGGNADIEGDLDIENAEIADLKLGAVKGRAQYRENLLSFPRLELKAIESAKGQGYVDFSPKETQYRFDINAPRISMEQTLGIFDKTPLPVQNPKGGELAARVKIEGGRDDKGIDVLVDGQARSFEWYGEKWMSAGFGLRYRPNAFTVNRGVFLKRSGSLEVKATYDQKTKQLVLFSSGLRLEDLNHLGGAPLEGEITGRIAFEGDLNYPRGNGELKLSKSQFREKKLPDCKVSLKTLGEESEYWLTVEGEKLSGHLLRKSNAERVVSQLDLEFEKMDFAPYVSAWLKKDISPLNAVVATGSWSMKGDFSRPDSLQGEAVLQKLKLDFEGKPLQSDEPVKILVASGGVEIPRLVLSGEDSEIKGSFQLVSDENLKAQLDGKLDFDFLQPFIPGLEFGTGVVGVKLRASGSPKNFDLFGNISLSDAVFRISGMKDEFRNVNSQLSVSADKITIERFQANMGGGDVVIGGDIGIERFHKFSPNLSFFLSKVEMKTTDYFKIKLTGDVALKGNTTPYKLSGNLRVDEAVLSSLQASQNTSPAQGPPALEFDIKAEAKDHLFIKADVVDAEFKGDFRLLGTTDKVGLVGNVELLKGRAIFKDNSFELISGGARFESADRIYPWFNINGRTVLREQKGRAYQDYEVNLQVLGFPDDYKIRLTSNPPLVEQDLISLLVLGVTTKGEEGNYFDLGTAIMGQSALKSKIQNQLGFDIKVQSASSQGQLSTSNPTDSSSAVSTSNMVPAVRIEKGLSKKTKLSYSNTLDQNQSRELRLEQMLNDNITLNATAGDRSRNNTQARPGDSFGLDLRYRFSFD